MSFSDWLMTQTDRDDPVGDLANDAERDPTAPLGGSVETWRGYLMRRPGVCWQARAALDQAIAEFQGETR